MPSSLCKDYPILSTSSALFQDASTKLKLEKILPNPSHQLVSRPFTTGSPLKAAVLIYYDPTAPSRLLSTMRETMKETMAARF
ncbi:unnamed protein product [Brassica oleracea]